jgi:leucyl aminopeptidase
MHFKLSISAKDDQLSFKTNSALVKFFIEGDNLEKLIENFFQSFNQALNPLQKKHLLNNKNDELIYYSNGEEPTLMILKKVKIGKDFSNDFFRDYFAGLIPSIVGKEINNLHVIVPAFKHFPGHFESDKYMIQTITEGIILGNYTFDKYKSGREVEKALQVFLHYSDNKMVSRVIASTVQIMDAVCFVRDFVNEPANTLTPQEFAKRTKLEFNKTNVKVDVFDKKELQRRKMNAILAVGGASLNDPLMLVLHYKPNSPKKKIALVGKGVTYDSGGYSIKPTASMIDMKTDMAGGAVVVGIIKAASSLKLPVEIIGVISCVENMLGGSSYKPGDIIKSYSGKTIEVKDTDAEGRIILADALTFASQQKPEEIIDFATLTGAIVVALGESMAGLFTCNDEIANKLILSSNKTSEKLWRMPFFNQYKELIKSEIADIANLGPRWGGAITAGKFLEYFVDENIPWAHLDIAGPSLKHKSTNYTEKYGTGFGVRLMIDYIQYIL